MTWLIKGPAWLLLGVLLAFAAVWSVYAGLNPYWPVMGVTFVGFSLFRSYKALVEVWRNRLSKKAEIEVTAEKGSYLPGEVLNVSVKVTGKEELDIEEGRVALVCANRYVYQYQTTDSEDNQVYRSKEVTDEVEAADERILEEKTILPGSYSGHEIAFEVPPTAAPSASGEITNVEWKVWVTLVIRGALDVIKELPLTILSTSESYASWAESLRYQNGSIREYAFAMDVPEAAGSCLETDQTYAAWRLSAVVKRRMAFDPWVPS